MKQIRVLKIRGNSPLLNFSNHSIRLGDKTYPTSEHFFQAMKATNSKDHEYVRKANTPKEAKIRGRNIKLRQDWEQVKVPVMIATIILKMVQHPRVRSRLLQTRNQIVEDRADPEWGRGPDGKGQNLMGKSLTLVRRIFERYSDA